MRVYCALLAGNLNIIYIKLNEVKYVGDDGYGSYMESLNTGHNLHKIFFSRIRPRTRGKARLT